MVFSSFVFLFRFLPIVLIIYLSIPKKWKNFVLFIASLFFYAWGEPIYVLLLLISTVIDYINGRVVHYYREKEEWTKSKCFVFFSVILNLALLGFFKYADFLIESWNHITNFSIGQLSLSLPIGISFYTFQTMSYTIDIYRGRAKVQNNIISFGTYVALFPQLIAGPIVRYETIAKELVERCSSIDDFSKGVRRFLIGLAKKVILANNIGFLWQEISTTFLSGEGISMLTAWIGAAAFTFQIYFDFSGYSDMAIGLGAMFGFHFPENFSYPYEAESITDFWRKWHISLSTWFREYVYIPLGGNRKGRKRQVIALFLVWTLTGIWHGAGYNFLCWGVYFAVLLIIEKFWLLLWIEKLPSFVRHFYTMLLVVLSWVIFAFDSLLSGGRYISILFGFHTASKIDQIGLFYLVNYSILFILLIIGCTSYPAKIANKYIRNKKELRNGLLEGLFLAMIFVFSIAYLVNDSYNPFLYFRF